MRLHPSGQTESRVQLPLGADAAGGRQMSVTGGFTLLELIVSMAIFIALIMISAYAFENIIKKGGQQVKSAETQTEGIVGLEMLRSDIEHAGYGIPWTIPALPAGGAYIEVAATVNPVTGITSSSYNEGVPSAINVALTPAGNKIIAGTSNTNPGASYLVIKSVRVPLNTAVSKWSYVNYSSDGTNNRSYVKKWAGADDLTGGERVITISSTFSTSGVPDKVLTMKTGLTDHTGFSYAVPGTVPAILDPGDDAFKPGDSSQLYVVYAIDPNADLRMPYNRADYYIRRPPANDPVYNISGTCNPGTGVLFKGVVRHSDASGNFAEYPLLNCVGDMQVEFELDPMGDGNIAISPTLAGLTAAQIRMQLKTVRVYLLAHEGKKDPNYSYPNATIQVGDPVRPSSSGRVLDGAPSCAGDNCMQALFGTDWRNYRWKVYTIVVRPKNTY